MKIDVLLGLQWGDEGKGKIVDVLSPGYDIIARFQGGPNAGHTISFDNQKFVLHTLPSGILNPRVINIIGNGVIIDPLIFEREVNGLTAKTGADTTGNLLISRRSHLILPSHRLLDAAYESAKGDAKIGSTLKGIGPTYTDKVARHGIRVGDVAGSRFKEMYQRLKASHLLSISQIFPAYGELKIEGLRFEEYEQTWMQSLETLLRYKQIDSEYFIQQSLWGGKRILAEGAQGTLLDVDFGAYPYVTSSNTIAPAVCTGLGIPTSAVGKVFGVFKAYCTRVGNGPFPTELDNEAGEAMRSRGHEYGATTGRPRRCGWLDIPALKYAVMVNGVTHLFMTKADVLSGYPEISVCEAYHLNDTTIDYLPYDYSDAQPRYIPHAGWQQELTGVDNQNDLPGELNDYIRYIENTVGVPVYIVSVGPERRQTIFMKPF